MAIVQALLAALFRSAGKLLNMAFGWATTMLFGRVPQDRQLYLSATAFGSVLWLVSLVAVAFPKVGVFLLAFVPLPDWVRRTWIRVAMIVAALLIPAVVGWLSTRLVDPAERPKGTGPVLREIARGYPYTVGLAVTLIVMTVFAPILKIRNVARRWSSDHVPVIIAPEDYLEVLRDVEAALGRGGIRTRRKPAGWMLRLPVRILMVFARRAPSGLVAENLTRLVGPRAEILVHPSDLVISGRELDVAHARAILAEQLTVTKAYLTWTKEANEIEDRVREIWRVLERGRVDGLADRLDALERKLRTLMVPYEEWEVLYRQVLLVDRALLRTPATAFFKTPELGKRMTAALIAAAAVVKRATDDVREVLEFVAPAVESARPAPTTWERARTLAERVVGRPRRKRWRRLRAA